MVDSGLGSRSTGVESGIRANFWRFRSKNAAVGATMERTLLWALVLAGVAFYPVSPFTFKSDTDALKLIAGGFRAKLQWNGDDPCGSPWNGVTCSSYNVTKLMLNNMNLAGQLHMSIGNLQNLQTLDLSFNPDLTGPLPKTLGQLTNLKFLNLQSCSFTGSIPVELGALKNLTFLALNMNNLSEIIPPELGKLSNVYWFDLAQNQITGPLPVSTQNAQNIGLDNLTRASHFHLNNNKFTGGIPREICFLSQLKHLLVDNNDLSDELPSEIGNLSSLTIMRLDKNQFRGSLPSTLGQLSKLTEINADDNAFSGTIPDLTGMGALQLISLGNNSFSPQPVPSFAGLTELQTIDINDGNLIGSIPDELFQLTSLESVSMRGNMINGTVDLRSASSSLLRVELDNNDITGVNKGSSISSLYLSGNPFCEGSARDPSLCSTNLMNSWKSPISCANSCSDQQVLNPNTCFCAFPLNFRFQFNAPTYTSMSNDRAENLTRSLSQGLNVTSDQVWVDNANFTSDKRVVIQVYIFPPNIQLRLSTETSSNMVNAISTHQVHELNNNFWGPYSLIIPSATGEEVGKHIKTSAGVVVGIVAVVIGVILIAAAGIYSYKQKRRAYVSNPFASWGSRGRRDSGSAPQLKGARFFSIAELKKATNNFSSSNEIGFGGYGKVYKGTLITEEEVAVKRAQEGSLQGASEFKNEIELLSRVHHRNLVGLIGFCYENGEQMLVYEYMSNGTIREHLPDRLEKLSWRKRLEIAAGSAKGIAYLHENANPPIIHRDIKSSNILLDEKYVAKVADFGLSKLAPQTDGKGHISTQVRGTLGYLDPEYYMTQQLTEKSDVYSFGVVLLELITAKHPIEHGKYIVREVRAVLDKGGIGYFQTMLDPNLRDYPREDLEKYLDVALSCVDESASKRPTMSEVVKELEIILARISSAGIASDHSGRRTNSYNDSKVLKRDNKDLFDYSGGFPHEVEPK